MKKITAFLFAALLFSVVLRAEGEGDMWTMQDDVSFYRSLTVSADYSTRPVFKPMAYTDHDLIEDIKVTAIESIPFGFLYTFAGLWVAKAISGGTLSPQVGSLAENQQTYFIAIGAFVAVNLAVNIFTFYDYNRNKPEDEAEKIKANP